VQRANIIIVTKCPANLSATDRNSIKTGWKLREIKSCITNIEFDEFIYSEKQLEK
jgi:hypothetical protein